ncbi:MAG: hypothetical protein NWF00_11865 [Candidatus Bathyarchaeota archaeon]|nr:hypothetical protein [Candidatus Bathyarchaeota archaeon]
MAIRNRCLYDKLIVLTKKVANFLGELPKEQFPTTKETVYLFKDNGCYETAEKTKTSYGWLFLNLREKISQFPELLTCANYMVNTETIRRTFRVEDKNGNPKEIEPILVYDFNLRFVLGRYFEQADSFIFNQQTFNTVYRDLEKFIYRKTVKGVVYSPLENFCFTDEIVLNKNLKIRQITEKEKAEFLNLQKWSTPNLHLRVTNISNMLEYSFSHSRSKKTDRRQYEEIFEDVITSLRLFKNGSVNFHIVSERTDLWQPYSSKGYSCGKHNYVAPLGQRYNLENSEQTTFKRVFNKYRKFQQRNKMNPIGYLNIAIHRFNQGIEEFEVEDKIIDFMISFEAMYHVKMLN